MNQRIFWIVVGIFLVVSVGVGVLVLGSKKQTISGIVIPHHDIVSAQRKEFLNIVGKKIQPQTIILVSPNHYSVGRANIQTADQTWNVTNGEIPSDSDVVQYLIKHGTGNEPNSFPDEHGIHLVLSDIHTTFPKATIVPLIIKMTTPESEIEALSQNLQTSCNACLMVSSVDFSHYQPAILGDLHDDATIRELENIDVHALYSNAEVDSPPALMLFALWAKQHNTLHFALQNHTNSGELLKSPDIESTTHVFGWYEAGQRVTAKPSATFLFGGDIMLGRMIAHTFLQKGMAHVFDQFGDRAFWGVDAGVVNLEGPISKTPVVDDYNSKNLIFNFPPQAIDALKFLRVNAVSLANNHSANQGRQGVDDTTSMLSSKDIQAIGGPGNQDISNVGIFYGEKLHLVVIGVHALYSPSDISELIKKYKQDKNNRIIIFPHWGVEYAPRHNSFQEQLSHAWIDAGADMVIGSHPHVIQDAEVYKNKPIIYSLGNF
ncbi:MAG: AmmeMemoRadiSam system protein B, partial [Candidatus Andersenbacteria bacterium]